jgi:hypothetical protein
MGKSQFKIAADLVIGHCLENGYLSYIESAYYWAYLSFFKEIDSNFDLTKFDDYILKRTR